MSKYSVILPGLFDRRFKTRFRGEVVRLRPKKAPELLAYAYGETLEEMRNRKRVICDALIALEASNE